uniref:DUF3752 domain-containing protein n=1 Tax=Syphacia muris TaxID=451379 RepID=A0A0N5AE18_9BILA
MSSPKATSDNNMQLPSLDELDHAEQSEYNNKSFDRNSQAGDEPSAERGFLVAVPPGDEPGPSSHSGTKSHESHQYIPPDVRHDQNSRSSLYDQLPNSISEHSTASSNEDHSQQNVIGPTLPPGFLGSDGNYPDDANLDDNDDPEDPGDPEDPEERGTKASLPRFPSSSQQEHQPFPDSRSPELIGPGLPSSFAQAPSLPDEEFRSISSTNSGSSFMPRTVSNSQIPPPEPDSVRNSGWQPSCANHKRQGQKTFIGPVFPPDVLPTVSNNAEQVTHVNQGNENDDEIYGPILPSEVAPGPSHRVSSGIEVPIEGDEHSGQQDCDSVIGPLPPTQEQLASAEKEYRIRLEQFNMSKNRNSNNNVSKREEWMVELPKKLANYGLGARKFSSKPSSNCDDDKVARGWTETPSDRQKRLCGGGEDAGPSTPNFSNFYEQRRNIERDLKQQKQADELNKNRNTSLLEMYQRKRKTDTEGVTEDKKIRQPFDRDRDMEVKGLGKNVSASEIKERMGQLSSRFACSSSKKFL